MSAIEIISASAGSGKTTHLATVLEEAIVSGRARPDAILATTFTTKAAAELTERARTRLLGAGRIEDAQRLAAARIGTVNAVCGRIVSDFAFELGHSPDMRILDERTAAVTMRQALSRVVLPWQRDWLAEVKQRFWGAEFDWVALVERLVTLAHANRIDASTFEEWAARSRAGFMPLFGERAADDDAGTLDAALAAALERFVATVDVEVDTTKKTGEALEQAWRELGRLRRGSPVRWKDWLNLEHLDVGKKSRDAAAPLWRAAAAHDRHPRLHDDVDGVIATIFGLGARALAAYAEYKRAWGAIDFADQEVYALQLLAMPPVRAQLQGEIDLVLVDEFQDTSPLQLAIFLQLAEIAPRSVWVGDQKQAIFGFRGTDPALMDAALAAIVGGREPTTLDRSRRSRPELVRVTSTLFAAAFAPQGIPPARVVLTPEPDSEPAGLGPIVERWSWRAKNRTDDVAALAAATRDFLADPDVRVRDQETGAARPVRRDDVAVLCHTNDTCADLAAALAAIGVRAVLPRTRLLATAEAQLVVAGLRVFVDARDVLAAAALARLVGFPADGDAWLTAALAPPPASAHTRRGDDDATAARDGGTSRRSTAAPAQLALPFATRAAAASTAASQSERGAAGAAATNRGDGTNARGTGTRFADLAIVRRIAAARASAPHAGALAAFDAVIEALDVRERCLEWGNAAMRLANVDALRAHAAVYADICAAEGAGCTPAGLVAALLELADAALDTQAVLAHDDAVVISTWHSAKGLEWPVTVLCDVDFNPRSSALGIQVASDRDTFDLSEPLAGRWLRFWPQPYHPQQNKGEFHRRLQQSPVTAATVDRDARQALRLLYVGWTRARDRLVLATRAGRLTAGALAELRDANGPLLSEPAATSGDVPADADAIGLAPRECTVSWGGVAVRMLVRESAPAPIAAAAVEPGVGYDTDGPREHPPALLVASSAEDGSVDLGGALRVAADGAPSTIAVVPFDDVAAAPAPAPAGVAAEELGARIAIVGVPDMASVGEAVHRFLAADRRDVDASERRALATALLERWGVAGSIDAGALVAAGDALRSWVERRWPGARWHREWPLLHRLPTGTVVRGTSDLVLEHADGFVVIDHKSFPGSAAQAVAKAATFTGQLRAYAAAVAAARGRPVTACFVHLPVSGIVVPLTV